MFERLRNRWKLDSATNRLLEERFFEEALKELESGQIRAGLWAKAIANSEGDEGKMKGLYLRYRVQAMVDEEEFTRQVVATIIAEQRDVGSERPAAKPVEPVIGEGEHCADPEEAMTRFGITYDGTHYHFRQYKYTNFADAVNYAAIVHGRKSHG